MLEVAAGAERAVGCAPVMQSASLLRVEDFAEEFDAVKVIWHCLIAVNWVLMSWSRSSFAMVWVI